MRLLVTAIALVAALVLSPMSACDRFEFHFGAAELRAAVEGTWQLTVPHRQPITFELRQSATPEHASRGWIRTAAACGDRSLVRNADACETFTTMPLDVAIVGGLPRDTKARGQVIVSGGELVAASLDLTVGAIAIGAEVSPQGVVTRLEGATTLVRVKH